MIIEIEELIKGIEITDWTVFGLAILCTVSITTCVLLFAEVNHLKSEFHRILDGLYRSDIPPFEIKHPVSQKGKP